MLTPQKIEHYKERLTKEKARLLAAIADEKKNLDFGSDVDHGDEETDEAEELGNELAVEHVLKNTVNEIDGALGKIEAGTYGVCEECGGAISEKVLSVAPESRLCEKCKKV